MEAPLCPIAHALLTMWCWHFSTERWHLFPPLEPGQTVVIATSKRSPGMWLPRPASALASRITHTMKSCVWVTRPPRQLCGEICACGTEAAAHSQPPRAPRQVRSLRTWPYSPRRPQPSETPGESCPAGSLPSFWTMETDTFYCFMSLHSGVMCYTAIYN